jgi:hypothetical protein
LGTKIDYLRLPFEVHYDGPVTFTSYDFKSDIEVESFKDVKAVHMEQGRAWGITFECSSNTGSELYCCLTDGHNEICPEWLQALEEDEMSSNFGCDYSVQIEGEEIRFVESGDEEIEDMDYCCANTFFAYHLGSQDPDYLILDANGSRVKIDPQGYEIDDNGNRINNQPLLDVEALDEDKLSEYSTRDLWEAKFDWVKAILATQFPHDKNLRLAFDSN